MAKNLADLMIPGEPGISDLKGLTRRLQNPSDYYHGLRHGRCELPDNVLMFGRTGSKTLAPPQMTGMQHFHHRHVLIVPVQGRGHMVLDGQTYALDHGQCALVAPYQFHYFIRFGGGSDPGAGSGPATAAAAATVAELDWLFITFERKTLRGPGSTYRVVSPAFWTDISMLVRDYLSGSGPDLAARLALRLALILHAIESENANGNESPAIQTAAATSNTTAGRGEDLLLRVHRLISASPGRMLSIAEIAAQIGMSESHLRARFRAVAGKSLGEFQREARLQNAADLLTRSGVTVTEAAEGCGWECPFAFSRAFRRYWGKPPKQFAMMRKRV